MRVSEVVGILGKKRVHPQQQSWPMLYNDVILNDNELSASNIIININIISVSYCTVSLFPFAAKLLLKSRWGSVRTLYINGAVALKASFMYFQPRERMLSVYVVLFPLNNIRKLQFY